MAPSNASASLASSRKRKHAPTGPSDAKPAGNKKHKVDHGARRRDARTLSTQTTSKAFQNGALDVSAFVKAREFEIHALEQGIQRSGKANNRRAFQLVPKELRRRTASHNAKRVPKRLRGRAVKEMMEDNTPTVNARTRKPTRHMLLRLDTLRKLRALGAQKKAARKKQDSEKADLSAPPSKEGYVDQSTRASVVATRKPRIKKKPLLATPPTPKAKFRKRQIHKTWLPTHLFHTKRAHMTPPSSPLWRFAVPISPAQKGYRPTHRAIHERGAVAWDMSYMSTIGLEGTEAALAIVLRNLGVDLGKAGAKWKRGLRARSMWAYERDSKIPIAPVTVVWCASPALEESDNQRRKLFIRVHPSAFVQLWEEVLRLARVAKPSVSVEDLRFEVGSIEIVGPGSTEALLGALWPYESPADGSVEKTWLSLAGVTTPATLPEGALLGFDIHDPRLHYPPRTIALPKEQQEYHKLLELIAEWPVDQTQRSPALFSRASRQQGAKLSSQKAINRRKSVAAPGGYPDVLPSDPRVPVVLYATSPISSSTANKHTSSWTILAPWKCIQPIWYSIQHYPLAAGKQPRFGGLLEQRQLAFEAGRPWFPSDYPGTKAGWDWEMHERQKRLQEWQSHPKGKRVSWEKVRTGLGEKGEVGLGWACDWALFLKESDAEGKRGEPGKLGQDMVGNWPKGPRRDMPGAIIPGFTGLTGRLTTVRLTLLTRGVPRTCARIYRLPSKIANVDQRQSWMNLHSDKTLPSPRRAQVEGDGRRHTLDQRRLAQSLLQPPQAGETNYPRCPGEEDLIGFATTGNFNLAEGRGTGIGCVVMERVSGEDKNWCVVRNSGEQVGRLAVWEAV